MKLIIAIIPAEKLTETMNALEDVKTSGLKVSPVRNKHPESRIICSDETPHYSDKFRIEVEVSEKLIKPVVSAIFNSAKTGKGGDGKVFIIPANKNRGISSKIDLPDAM